MDSTVQPIATVPARAAASRPLSRWLMKIPRPIRRDFRRAWRTTSVYLNRHRWPLLITLVLFLTAIAFTTWPNDMALSKEIRGGEKPEIRELAKGIGWWGNMAQYNFMIVGGLWLAGKLRKSAYLRRLAVVVFLSTTLSGLTCNIFRFTLSRARPWVAQKEKLDHTQLLGYGYLRPAKYHSFPSGHTSTAFGSAVPVAVAVPVVGVPILAFAGAMGWARIYDKAHYPSDILIGAFIGTVFGLAGGLPARKLRRRIERQPATTPTLSP